jgi:polyisoprenoid-binding protein YceI
MLLMKRWSIDPDHSLARFSVRHFMIANVEGLFSNMTGVIQFDPPDLTQLSVEAEIDVKNLTTGHPERDEHLKNIPRFSLRARTSRLRGAIAARSQGI